MPSAAEREMRDAAAAKLRELLPGARIVHELNVAGQGSNRLDLAAIAVHGIVGVEIKSKHDTLKRLPEQVAAFRKCCHRVVVVADQKHFEGGRLKGEKWPTFTVWKWPSLAANYWNLEPRWLDFGAPQPRASHLLAMLWVDELRVEAGRHNIAAGPSSTHSDLVHACAWNMTGQEIVLAVCRQLRARPFVEADPPVSVPIINPQGEVDF